MACDECMRTCPCTTGPSPAVSHASALENGKGSHAMRSYTWLLASSPCYITNSPVPSVRYHAGAAFMYLYYADGRRCRAFVARTTRLHRPCKFILQLRPLSKHKGFPHKGSVAATSLHSPGAVRHGSHIEAGLEPSAVDGGSVDNRRPHSFRVRLHRREYL